MKKQKNNYLYPVCCLHCNSENYVRDRKRKLQCKSCKKTFFFKKAIACSHCKKLAAFKINSYTIAYCGRTKNIYKCNSCGKRTNVIIGSSQPEITNKEIVAIDKLDISYKLAAWRKGYLKRRSEPKKYEPMLYFLDYFNGVRS